MAEIPRRSVARAAEVSGVGLFTGAASRVRIVPGEAGEGITFQRVDGRGRARIAATLENAGSAPELPGRNTSLRAGDVWIHTVEHLLSALAGLNITDALVEVDGPEVPIADGSAKPFVEAVLAAGLERLPGYITPIVITGACSVEGQGGRVEAGPAGLGGYRYELDYGPGAAISPQGASVELGPGLEREYIERVAPARTFCLEAEARAMKAAGLFGHLSPREMLVIGAEGPIDNTLRFSDEPARHKLLDLIGDLALTGRPIIGSITAQRSGHALNRAMASRLLEQR